MKEKSSKVFGLFYTLHDVFLRKLGTNFSLEKSFDCHCTDLISLKTLQTLLLKSRNISFDVTCSQVEYIAAHRVLKSPTFVFDFVMLWKCNLLITKVQQT